MLNFCQSSARRSVFWLMTIVFSSGRAISPCPATTLPCSGMACTLLLCSDMAMIAMAMAADFDCQVIVFLCLCVFFMIPFPFIRYARGMTSCSVIYLTFYCIKNRMLFFSIGLNLPIYKRKNILFLENISYLCTFCANTCVLSASSSRNSRTAECNGYARRSRGSSSLCGR